MKLTLLTVFCVLGTAEVFLEEIMFPKWLQKYPLPPMPLCEENCYVPTSGRAHLPWR